MRLCALVLLLIAAPLGAAAQNYILRPDLAVSHEYDDNVFSRERNERSSWVSRVSPGLSLVRKDERSRLSLEGELTSRTYWSFNDLDAVDKRIRLNGNRRVTPRLTLEGRARLAFLESRDSLFEGEAQELEERPDLDLQVYELEARYQLSPRTSLIPSVEFEDRDYDDSDTLSADSDLRDRSSVTLGVALDHVLTPLDRLQFSFRHEDEDEEPASSDSDILDRENQLQSVILTWVRAWSPRWSSNMSIGHRWIREELKEVPTTVFTSPGFPFFSRQTITDDETNRTTGTVGSVKLTRTLARGELQFGYTRDARSAGAASAGGTIESDSFFATWTHSLNSRVKLTLSGSWSDYESTSQFDVDIARFGITPGFDGMLNLACPPGSDTSIISGGIACTIELPSEIDVEQLFLQARVDWRIRRRLNAFVRFSYFDRDSDGFRLNSQTRRRVMAGFRYHFDQDL